MSAQADPSPATREDVILTGPMPPATMEALQAAFQPHLLYEAADRAAMLASLPDCRLVASSYGMPVDGPFMDALPRLEIIANFGVGVDNIDLAAARARGIRVTNTPGVLNDAVAELTLGLMLALARQIPQADRYVREGRWERENHPLTAELTGATLGILGLGRIGHEIARRAQVFGMRVVYCGRTQQRFTPYPWFADIEAMAREVDWLVSVVPGDTGTKGIISAAVLEALGPEGFLVNIGRGSAVDEAALLAALREGRIRGAALDVFEDEPRMDPGFWELSNVILSPHQGSATEKTRWQMGDLMVRNLLTAVEGRPPLTPVV